MNTIDDFIAIKQRKRLALNLRHFITFQSRSRPCLQGRLRFDDNRDLTRNAIRRGDTNWLNDTKESKENALGDTFQNVDKNQSTDLHNVIRGDASSLRSIRATDHRCCAAVAQFGLGIIKAPNLPAARVKLVWQA
jgi:hypothetical protein